MGTGVEIELNIINIRLSQIQEGDNLHIETYEKIGLHKRYIHHTEKNILIQRNICYFFQIYIVKIMKLLIYMLIIFMFLRKHILCILLVLKGIEWLMNDTRYMFA